MVDALFEGASIAPLIELAIEIDPRVLMQNRGRGSDRRGRGRGNPYHTEFPGLYATSSKKGESRRTAKDVLLAPESSYFQNSIVEKTVLYINTEDIQWINDPWEIKRQYLTTQNSPPHFDQYRYIFEQILTELESIDFKHTLAEPNCTASPINYSKATIQQILPMQAWGMHPHVIRIIEIRNKESRYNYWDYIDAFTQAFYYMNPPRSHSWFFYVLPDILKNDLPNWFLVWWDKFGLQLDAFPEPIRLAFNEWQVAYSKLPVHKDILMSKATAHFVIRFGIPWIWKWDFQCDFQNKIPRLKRVFFYKWWNKMDDPKPHQELLQKIKAHTQACWDATPKLIPAAPVQNLFVQVQNELRQKFPGLTEQELVIKSMDFMKEQFLQSFSRDDTSMKSGFSSHGGHEEDEHFDPLLDENEFTVLAGESQDPTYADPNFGDYWDSLTGLIAEKMSQDKQDKGKGKAD